MQRLVITRENMVVEDFTNTIDKEYAISQGAEMLDCELGYDGGYYITGFAPEEPSKSYSELRVAEYPPIGDQLDAILKGFVVMRDSGVLLHPETNALIDYWQSVKQKFPKSEGSEA